MRLETIVTGLGLGGLILAGTVGTVRGQAAPELPRKSLYLNSVLGVSVPNFSDLNAELSRAGFLRLPKAYFGRGAGFFTIFPKLRLASLFNFTSYSATNAEGGRGNWVRATTAGTSFGLVLRNTERVQIIPYAGAVYSWFGARISRSLPTGGSFGGYLNGPANEQHLAKNGFQGNLGLHLGKPLGQGTLSRKVLLGLRVGYAFPLGNPAWRTDQVSLSGGPTVNPGGAYAHILLAFAQ
jgi:hypothetical protein